MKPVYRRASTTGESLVLENDKVRFVLWKRICGWGFGELYTPEGRLMAVLDHFGELMLRDQEIPMRLEAKEYEAFSDGDTEGYIFKVETTMAAKMLKGTSFESWVHFPFEEPILSGTVTVSLKKGDDRIGYAVSLTSNANVYARYLRLFWLLCGEGSYGTKKTDALLPGVDWPVGEEWSSGTDFFKDPWANRCIPHPNKVASPVMAVSEGGDAVAVSYDLDTPVTRWFNYNENYAQPVFACPNFIERMNNNLLGIMLPDVKSEAQENKPFADECLEMHIGQRISFNAELYTVKGKSLDALVSWVKRYGLPVPQPTMTYDEAQETIARAYNTSLWHEGEGFGYRQRPTDGIGRSVPHTLRRWVSEHPDTDLAKELSAKIAWCDGDGPRRAPAAPEKLRADRIARGDQILSWQKPDGTFRFEPDGRHYAKDDFRVARAFIEPMGVDQDTALYMNTTSALDLMTIWEKTGEERFRTGALAALDACADMFRPEGGDYWETPLHAPNLLAAAGAANTYAYAARLFGRDDYREKAVWYLRSLLAFTHLRKPKNVPSLYNTKPCLCSSDWYFANWVRDFVQWEVLNGIEQSAALGISWAELDPEIDWNRYRYGVTTAVYNWMSDTEKKPLAWRPHNIPGSLDYYLKGDFNGCFSDTFNSVTGNTGGMFIPPSAIAACLYAIRDEASEVTE